MQRVLFPQFGPADLWRHHLLRERSDTHLEQRVPGRYLRNPIHPFFRYDVFRNIPWQTMAEHNNPDTPFWDDEAHNLPLQMYQRMEPALRLATIMLERNKPLLLSLMNSGFVHTDQGRQADATYVPTDFDKQMLEEEILVVAAYTRIGFIREQLLPDQFGVGATTFNRDPEFNRRPNHNNVFIYVVGLAVGFDAEFWTPDWDRKPRHHRETMWATLAVTLVHEITHVMWLWRNQKINKELLDKQNIFPRPEEPCVLPFNFNEYGLVTELFQFGGSMWPGRIQGELLPSGTGYKLDLVLDGSRGLRMYCHDRNGATFVTFEVTPKTVHSLFVELTWENNAVVSLFLMPGPIPSPLPQFLPLPNFDLDGHESRDLANALQGNEDGGEQPPQTIRWGLDTIITLDT